ncbi:DNA photolyase class 1, 8-HDF type [Artemisia annua]|uniref:DNA photolyase class 1, 8-HDF type n=1 Tax=Artemisia annua TaxID=35608 RepID=A0A2U1P1Y4_ARTAN|nr:DNA photolyase class 1, 8-HDF type [Artemisia annua]
MAATPNLDEAKSATEFGKLVDAFKLFVIHDIAEEQSFIGRMGEDSSQLREGYDKGFDVLMSHSYISGSYLEDLEFFLRNSLRAKALDLIKWWNKEKVNGLKVRNTIAVAGQFKSLPSVGNVKAGEIMCLADLGINQTAYMIQLN